MSAGLRPNRPCEDYSHNQFGGAKECETVMCNVGAYKILQEVHQKLCPYYHADGEVAKEGCDVLLE